MPIKFQRVEAHPSVQQALDWLGLRFPLGRQYISNAAIGTDQLDVTPQARVYNSAAISVTNATPTAITFDSERWDRGTTTEQHSTSANTGRLTCRVAGDYVITGHVEFASNATGARSLWLDVNRSGVLPAVNSGNALVGGLAHAMSVSATYRLAVNDYVELFAYQTSGGALNVTAQPDWSPQLSWAWLSP